MPVAFVLSGGASLGSVQAGMALALEERDIVPDLVFGTSVGALNGAWLAARKPAAGLGDVWRGIRRREMFPLRPILGMRAFLGRTSNFVPNSGLKRLIRTHIPFDRLEDAPIPLAVIATAARSGDEVVLTTGPTVEAIAASAALPGVFPPIERDGLLLIDGGVANNTPIARAVAAGATEVWVLSTGYSCGLVEPPKGAVAMGMHAAALLVQQRFVLELQQRRYDVPVHLIPPPCPVNISPVDFSRTEELIERAHAGATQWLANGQPHALPLLHRH